MSSKRAEVSNDAVIDRMAEYVRVSRLAKSYNERYQASIKPWELVQAKDRDGIYQAFTSHPNLFFDYRSLRFARAILHGKPAFDGDRIWLANIKTWYIVNSITGGITDESCAWEAPAKVVKKKFRVALFKELSTSKTYTVSIDTQDGADSLYKQSHFVKFLTDWIEYDDEFVWPSPLVARIAQVDLKAAEWLCENFHQLHKYSAVPDKDFKSVEALSNLFCWDMSPQGNDYWKEVYQKLIKY